MAPKHTSRQTRIALAEAYVRTRFFPPLPHAYGELAVRAVEEYHNYGPGGHVNLPEDLPVVPKGARLDLDGNLYVTAAELIRILRIGHLIDDTEE